MIEQNNPHIQFDWTRILKGQGDPGEQPERRERPAPEARRRPMPSSQAASAVPQEPPQEPVETGSDAVDAMDLGRPDLSAPDPDPDSVESIVVSPEIAPLPELSASDEFDQPEAPVGTPDEGPVTAAHARLGSEGVSRLRARYADIMAGISDRIHDPERASELKAQAERLNPDCWVTEEEVRQGLEQYETVFDSLRSVVGRRRRRRRR